MARLRLPRRGRATGAPTCPPHAPIGAARRAWFLLGTVVVVGLVSGCTGSERPQETEWRPRWEAVAALVPAPSEADDLEPDRCELLLVAAREARPELEPAPMKTLDELAIRWLDLAEEVGFECADTADLDDVLAELRDLQGRILEELDADGAG